MEATLTAKAFSNLFFLYGAMLALNLISDILGSNKVVGVNEHLLQSMMCDTDKNNINLLIKAHYYLWTC